MRTGNRDALLEPHQFRQHFGAPHDRQTPFARGDEFRIVAPDCGRDDDDLGLPKMGRIMADMNSRAFGNQAPDIGVLRSIRALHLVAEIQQNLGNPRHTDAAYADKVNGT
jgi:hypothetical protein